MACVGTQLAECCISLVVILLSSVADLNLLHNKKNTKKKINSKTVHIFLQTFMGHYRMIHNFFGTYTHAVLFSEMVSINNKNLMKTVTHVFKTIKILGFTSTNVNIRIITKN
jgi:hypothetical protein